MAAVRGVAVAAVLAVVSVCLTVAGLVVQFGLPLAWRPEVPMAADVPAGLTFPVVGAFLVLQRPRHVLAWLMCWGGLACALNVAGKAGMLQAAASGQMELAGVLRNVGATGWAAGGALLAVLLPLFAPDGRLPSRRWLPVSVLAVVVTLVEVVRSLLRPDPSLDGYPYPVVIANPLAVDFPFSEALHQGVFWALQALIVSALVSMVLRLRGADPVVRRQIAWPLAAFSAYVVCLLAGPGWWAALVVATALIPVAIAFSVLRYRLFDFDELIGRALVAGGLLAAVGAAYLAVTGAASVFVAGYDHAAGLLAAVATGAFFHPLHVRLRRLVDRAMYGTHGDPRRLTARLADEVRDGDPVTALAAVTEVTRDGLGATGVAVEVLGGRRAVSGELGDAPRAVPLVWHGEPVGTLLVGPQGARRFSRDYTERLVAAAAPYLSDVAHAVRMSADLQRSRERILTAREEERRRLRRDLHDGLGQALAGMSMSLARAGDSPGAADRLLGDLREGMNEVAQEVRELVYGLSPPTLEQLGLAGAVRALAGPGVVVETRGDLEGLPAVVETAAYRIAQEALTNAAKHARASWVRVSLRRTAAGLAVRVEDDGVGVPSGAESSVGFASMRERAAELGGSCAILPRAGGGTRVKATLPLSSV
ncbi:sensor histidine kinase [Nonomuraea sp. NPDC050556]|uniref:sensor histidine kinase n=1 Tax=Nonomuraea sp. NPDC050556 TaxID=3364369 RepID=UPI0037AE98A4